MFKRKSLSPQVGALLIGGLLVASLGVSPALANPGSDRAPTATAEPTAPSPTAESNARADSHKYCATTNMTGSHLPRRICKTRAEWARDGVDVDHPSE